MSSKCQPETVLPERYQVLRHLADGGMASVWCAWDSLLHRKVAIKVLSGAYLEDPWAVSLFSQEARAGARLSSHANIVTIYDVGVGGDSGARPSPFIVMEYLIGGTVGDAIRLESVSAEQAVTWIRQAAAGIDYAHRHGVVHGDIKPANLLLDGEHTAHVSDFGLARILSDEGGRAPERFGTAAYLSPEQASGAPPSPASDRYALGVVAFELLTGQRPFAAEQTAAVIRHHLQSAVPAASSRKAQLPGALDAVFTRALAKREDERWPSAMACAAAIEQALTKRRLVKWPARPLPRRPVKRRRAAAVAALALAASLAGVGVGLNGGPAPVNRVQHHANLTARSTQKAHGQAVEHRRGHRDQRQAQRLHATRATTQPTIPIYEGPVHPNRHATSRPAPRPPSRKAPERPAPPHAPRPPNTHRHAGKHAAPGAGPAMVAQALPPSPNRASTSPF